MAIIIFKYFLPILLGYTLFVGLTGRLIPLPRPKATVDQPMWFLGLWTGVVVAAIAIYGLQLAYAMELNALSTLLAPGALLLGATMLPGIIGFLAYRSSVNHKIRTEYDVPMFEAMEPATSNEFDKTLALDSATSSELDETVVVDKPNMLDIDEQSAVWATDRHGDVMELELDETQLFEIAPSETHEPATSLDANPVFFEELDLTIVSADIEADTATIEIDLVADDVYTNSAAEIDAVAQEIESQLAVELFTESEIQARVIAEQTASMAEIIHLRDELTAATEARIELETHLRATRSGLGALESESRQFASTKAAALMQMEQELEEKIKRTSAAEARADREETKRVDLENEIVNLREDALRATNESRSSVEARAKALSTASKATTFARQAMQIRTRLETQLHDAEAELDSKQSTISSLTNELEKEKARTLEDVSAMAKRILQETQSPEKQMLEDVSRNANDNLSSRLVKNVAKARG